MAPIEPDLSNSNFQPLSLLGGYGLLMTGLTGLISYGVLYKAYKALPPSQDTRKRTSNRHKHLKICGALALVSLLVSCYHSLSYLILSYRVWAHEVGQELPSQIVYANGTLNLPLGRWWTDTSILLDASEIVIEQSKRVWWTQQFGMGIAVWSVFVGIEGRRRNIRHLWAFLLLGQTVSLAFAMNLFFIAVILAPIPLSKPAKKKARTSSTHKRSLSSGSSTPPALKSLELRDRATETFRVLQSYLPPLPTTPHPSSWTPHPLALIGPLAVVYFSIFLLPFSTSTETFIPILLLATLPLYQPLYFGLFTPFSYGSTTKPHRTYLDVYAFLSYASSALYIKQTFVALLDNDPGAHQHRHSAYLAKLHLPHEGDRTLLWRSSNAMGTILGSLGDHPAIAKIGWDVLLCAVSLATWSSIRGLSVPQMLAASGFGPLPTSSRAAKSVSESSSLSTAVPNSSTAMTPATPRRRRGKSTTVDEFAVSSQSATAEANLNPDSTFHPTPPTTESSVVRASEEEQPENPEAGAVAGAMYVLGGLGVLGAGVLGAREV